MAWDGKFIIDTQAGIERMNREEPKPYIPPTVLDAGTNCKVTGTKLTKVNTNVTGIVRIPQGITVIGENAFNNCDSIDEIQIPDSVQVIEKQSIAWTSIKRLYMPPSVKTCSQGICRYNRQLTEVVWDTEASIPAAAFDYCTALTTVDIRKTIPSMDTGAFNFCTRLKPLVIRAKTVSGISDNYARIEDITCEEGLTELYRNAFAINGLKRLELPHSLGRVQHPVIDTSGIDIYYHGTEEDRNAIIEVGAGSTGSWYNARWHYI